LNSSGSSAAFTELIDRDTPADRFVGLRRDSAAGRDAVRITPAPRILDADGRLMRGALFLAADVSLGVLLHRDAPEGQRLVTSHLQLAVAAGDAWMDGEIVCVPDVISVADGSALATGRFLSNGYDFARATARFEMVTLDARAAEAPTTPDSEAPTCASSLSQASNLDAVADLAVSRLDDTTATVHLVAHPDFANERGGVHGGMGGLLTERIATRAIAEWVGPSRLTSAVEMRTFFTRPFAAAGQLIAGRVTMRRLGRRIAVTSTEVYDAAGKTLLLADAVHVLSDPPPSRAP
jgi:uncharacterized protein (TIGR00369 family)